MGVYQQVFTVAVVALASLALFGRFASATYVYRSVNYPEDDSGVQRVDSAIHPVRVPLAYLTASQMSKAGDGEFRLKRFSHPMLYENEKRSEFDFDDPRFLSSAFGKRRDPTL